MADPPMLPTGIFDHNTAILGRTGSGKSYAARGITECWLDAGRRVCIVDPTDVWYGLRSNAEGLGPGYPVVVFGGEHGDVPIGERSGGRIAEIVAGRNLPAIVATAEMTVGERHRFMTEFLGGLFRLNRAPLHLVLDEADDVAPQNPLPENRRMLGDVERIVRRGRVRGFRVMMITQRSAVLNKNILTQASVLVALRLPAKQDRDAIQGWISGQADTAEASEVLGSLSRLQRGEGWVWAPEQGVLERTHFPPIRTFNSMRTPEHGEAISAPPMAMGGLAAVELGDLRALLEAPDAAAAHQTDEKAAKAEREAAERRGYNAGHHAGYVAGWEKAMEYAAHALRGAAEHLARAGPGASAEELAAEEMAAAAPSAVSIDEGPCDKPRNFPVADAERTNGALPSSAAKMIAVLARGVALTWPQTATLAGLKARGGHFNAGRKALRDGGYVAERNDAVVATDKGMAAAGGAQPSPEGAGELLAWWRSALPQTAGRVLDQLHRQGRWTGKDRLAGFLNLAPRGGHWNGALSILRRNGLIEIKGDQLRIAAELRAKDAGHG